MKFRFVPTDVNVADFAAIQPLFDALLARPIANVRDLGEWLLDASELSAVIDEYGSRVRIDHTCHTDDAEIEKRYMHFVEQITPKITPLNFQLEKKCLDALDVINASRKPGDPPATGPGLDVLWRQWRADVELFREENVPLQMQVTKTVADYGKICGAMMVDFRGNQYTLQQLGRFLEDPDRATRQEAWEISSRRRLADRARIDELFDRLMQLRRQIAANAGCSDFCQYKWRSSYRFDYTPDDCLRFADAIERTCMPVVRQLNEARRKALGVDRLRPWDMAVDLHGRPPLAPFPADDALAMLDKVREIFNRISPQLAEQFSTLKPGRNLDLDSRKGKRPGGYQSSLEVSREPFIFMNAAGMHRDVETMLHEAGHAFHYMAAKDQPLVFLRHAPLEFCEVASMSMELLGADHFDVFYSDPSDAARAKEAQFEGVLRLLPWIATIDSFQHWLYTHPSHTQAERTAKWLEIFERFSDSTIDWSGYDDAKAARWHAQLHVFHYPFYYIEYGIAQLGALQVWRNYRNAPAQALAGVRRAFELGGAAPLPTLFETAGIRFDFSEQTLGPLMDAVRNELAAT